MTRHIFLTYAEPRKVISTLVIVSLLLVGLYFYFGRMKFYLWVSSIAVVIGFRVIQSGSFPQNTGARYCSLCLLQ